MRGVVMFLAASALLPAAACTASPGPERPMGEMADARYGSLAGENVRQISGGELRDLVSGSSLSPRAHPPSDQPVISVPTTEIFQADRTYIRVVENVRGFGHYVIRRDTVCSTLNRQERCRIFFRAMSGEYYMTYIDSPQSIIEIKFSRL